MHDAGPLRSPCIRPVEVRMLGPIELLAQGAPIGPIAAKPRALLVYLALAPGASYRSRR